MFSVGSKPVGIALLGFSERDMGVLAFFLEKQGTNGFLIVPEANADLCVLDLDSVNGQKLLQRQLDRHRRRPLIALSVRDADIDNVRVLRKPLRTDVFKSVLELSVRELARRSSVEETQAPSETAPISVSNLVPELASASVPVQIQPPKGSEEKDAVTMGLSSIDRRSALPSVSAQARIIHGSCGVGGTVDLDMTADLKKLFYEPRDYFQHALKGAVDQCRHEARPLHLQMSDEKYVTLLPKTNIALTNLSDTKLRPRCLIPINHNQINIEYRRESEIHLLSASTEIPQSIDALLWKVTLWSSRGRLPVGTRIDSVIRLRQWPNLTRLMAIPQFLRIAALWAKNPSPLNRTVELLNIEARYVCAFFSACCALELTQALTATVDREALPDNASNSGAPAGLLRRILHRLRVA